MAVSELPVSTPEGRRAYAVGRFATVVDPKELDDLDIDIANILEAVDDVAATTEIATGDSPDDPAFLETDIVALADPATAWHMHHFATGLREYAERLTSNADRIDSAATAGYLNHREAEYQARRASEATR